MPIAPLPLKDHPAVMWALLVSPSDSLASIGLIAFAAMAQFAPHLILAAHSGQRDPLAAKASLATGLVLWCYTLALPPIVPQHWLEGLARGLTAVLKQYTSWARQPGVQFEKFAGVCGVSNARFYARGFHIPVKTAVARPYFRTRQKPRGAAVGSC